MELGVAKILNIGIFKLQPKIVVQNNQFDQKPIHILREFWECKSGLGYFIPTKVLFFNAQSWALWSILGKLTAKLFAFKNNTLSGMK